MNELEKPGNRLRKKRREMGLSQKALADLIECAPSALCMFEKGKSEALSVERLNKACEVLKLSPGALLETIEKKYCPNADCPSHHPLRIGNEIRLKPEGVSGESNDRFCRWCGEVLIANCEGCGAKFNDKGACCGSCGMAYVDVSQLTPPSDSTNTLYEQLRIGHNGLSSIRSREMR